MTVLLLALTAVLLGANLVLSAWALHKVRRIDQRTWSLQEDHTRSLDNLYWQIEALTGLYAETQPVRGLPATRGWAASPDFLLHLARAARDQRPQTIVECSCGTSTIVLARICELNGQGHVFSLEHESRFAAITREHLRRHGLERWATVIDAPLAPSQHTGTPWYNTAGLAVTSIDLLVVDGPPAALAAQARYPAGPHLLGMLAPGGQVFVDDAGRPQERAMLQQWLQDHPDLQRVDMPAEKGLTVLTRTGQAASA